MKTATATQVKERPILFSGPMVRAILDGRKTQTRRVIKPQPESVDLEARTLVPFNGPGELLLPLLKCPYGKVGDRLWVRETWRPNSDYFTTAGFEDCGVTNVSTAFDIRYAEDGGSQQYWHNVPKDQQRKYTRAFERLIDGQSKRWKPSIHMPRWASRITLEITNIRIERLQDISEEDAKAEGVCLFYGEPDTYRITFQDLWDEVNGKKHPWAENSWVWVLEFKKI